jgi:hypothetical protein
LIFTANNTFLVLKLVSGSSGDYVLSKDLFTALRAIEHIVVRAFHRAGGCNLVLFDAV